jgi:peptide/nickel transport system substrate-binding protein
MTIRFSLLAGVATLALLSASADAKPFRYATSGDLLGLDPHLNNEALTNGFKGNVYEGLVVRAPDLKLEPGLATAWSQTSPTTWRFTLRQGVKFHDGSPFTADDVVFSVARFNHPNSTMAPAAPGIVSARKVDDNTVELTTKAPDPIVLQGLPFLFIMSKSWSEKNASADPGAGASPTTYANLNANGTGPFKVKERVPDQQTVLLPHGGWWGKPAHNVTEVVYRPIKADATRLAALVSGEIDMMFPVAPQDKQRLESTPGIRVLQGQGVMTVFFGLDQGRAELLDMPGTGKNPLKDKRVRQAMYQAIDMDSIVRVTMRGAASPTGLLIAPGIEGFDAELNKRYPFDPDASKKLLTEAGYPDGFPITLDCPNDRYVNDEAICQAVTAMLARVGVKVKLNAQTKALHFAKAGKPGNYNTSMYMLGWIPGTFDAHHVLVNLMTEGGIWNAGMYKNPKVEELTKAVGLEMDPAKRKAMMIEALKIHKEDFGHIPLLQQATMWGVRDTVAKIEQSPLDFVYLKDVVMK